MAERAVFLDRDDTIIDNDGYLGDPSKVKLLPGAATAMSAIRALGYRLIVVSNQSGVARGMFDEAAVEAVNDEMSRQLREQAGAYIDASYYCPYHPAAPIAEYRVDHEWRKPKPGMLKQAAADFGLDLAQCWMVGDQGRDIAAGVAAGCRTILLRDGDKNPGATADVEAERMEVSPGFVVRTLADAARIIVREGKNPPTPAVAANQLMPKPVPKTASVIEKVSSAESHQPKVAVVAPVAPVSAAIKNDEVPADLVVEKTVPHAIAEPALVASGRLERSLDEMVILMRQQHRNADLRPDFSLANMAALIVQGFAIIALVIGLTNHFTTKATYLTALDLSLALINHQTATMWVTVAVMLQGVVISLLLYARHK